MTDHTPESCWFIPAIVVQLPDGSTLIKPGKAIQRATVSRAVRLTGVHRKTLHALADCGLLRRDRPSLAQSFFYPAEIEAFLQKTADEPEFWDDVRKKAFLTGSDLRNAKPR